MLVVLLGDVKLYCFTAVVSLAWFGIRFDLTDWLTDYSSLGFMEGSVLLLIKLGYSLLPISDPAILLDNILSKRLLSAGFLSGFSFLAWEAINSSILLLIEILLSFSLW